MGTTGAWRVGCNRDPGKPSIKQPAPEVSVPGARPDAVTAAKQVRLEQFRQRGICVDNYVSLRTTMSPASATQAVDIWTNVCVARAKAAPHPLPGTGPL